MTNPTDTSAAAIAALLDGVTDGPWGSNVRYMFGPISDEDDQSYGMVLSIGECDYENGAGGPNSKFIAAARALVPALRQSLTDAEAHIARLTPAPDWELDALVEALTHAGEHSSLYLCAVADTITALRAQIAALTAVIGQLHGPLSIAALTARADAAEADAERLAGALAEARRAIGDHHAPNDCYATGPLTGDAYRDLVQCPACSAIAAHDAALAAHAVRKGASHE